MPQSIEFQFRTSEPECENIQNLHNQLERKTLPSKIDDPLKSLKKYVSQDEKLGKEFGSEVIEDYFDPSFDLNNVNKGIAFAALTYAKKVIKLIQNGSIEIIVEGDNTKKKSKKLKKLVLKYVKNALKRAESIENLHKIHTVKVIREEFRRKNPTSQEVYERHIQEGTSKEFIASILNIIYGLYFFQDRDEQITFMEKYRIEDIPENKDQRLSFLKDICKTYVILIKRIDKIMK